MTFWLNDLGIVSAMGIGQRATIKCLNSLQNNETTQLFKTSALSTQGTPFYVGHVDSVPLCNKHRIDRLIDLALAQIMPTLSDFSDVINTRIAVVIGTSTSGVHDGERARATYDKTNIWPSDFLYADQELATPSHYIAKKLNALGPCYSISTACTSSAKALISAKALLKADLADVVICGGVDSLCKLTLNGFDALASLSADVCKPFSDERNGINIGEGAALFVMSKRAPKEGGVAFLGGGESSDAHHISAPDPSGKGARTAMVKALDNANLSPNDIDYINAHGTATVKNDEMEALAINNVFGNKTPLSSSKHLTGHTLGAAGAVEAGICWLLLKGKGKVALPFNDCKTRDDLANINLVEHLNFLELKYCLSNNFAFGGNNASIILGAS